MNGNRSALTRLPKELAVWAAAIIRAGCGGLLAEVLTEPGVLDLKNCLEDYDYLDLLAQLLLTRSEGNAIAIRTAELIRGNNLLLRLVERCHDGPSNDRLFIVLNPASAYLDTWDWGLLIEGKILGGKVDKGALSLLFGRFPHNGPGWLSHGELATKFGPGMRFIEYDTKDNDMGILWTAIKSRNGEMMERIITSKYLPDFHGSRQPLTLNEGDHGYVARFADSAELCLRLGACFTREITREPPSVYPQMRARARAGAVDADADAGAHSEGPSQRRPVRQLEYQHIFQAFKDDALDLVRPKLLDCENFNPLICGRLPYLLDFDLTAMHVACYLGSVKTLGWMIEMGVDLKRSDGAKRRAAHYAVIGAKKPVLDILRKQWYRFR
jgi:hypothetical protein